MRHLALASFLLACTACNTPAFRKADSAADTMKSAADTVDALNANASAARAELDRLLAVDSDLARQYGLFVRAADRFDSDIERVKRSVGEVETATNGFVAGYVATREEIKNPDLRAAMLVRKEQVERQLGDMKVKASALLTAAAALAQEFADLRKFLSANLNTQAIGSASVVIEGLERRAAEIEEAVRGMKIELTDLASSLTSQRPN